MYNAFLNARRFFDLGFKLIEVEPFSKKPVAMNWSKSFAKMEDFALRPSANIGIVTGMVSGICVIDFDDDVLYQKYLKRFGSNTTTVARGNHHHLYFRIPDFCIKMPSHPNFIKGLDFSADGRFIMAPGNRHPSGDVYYESIGFECMIPFEPEYLTYVTR